MNWDTLYQSSLEEILEWAESQSWAKAMVQCKQDAQWHAEGDVWTHTKMVCRELPQLDEWANLDNREQKVLIFTALFHDSGKPMTSHVESETGRIRTPKHALKGEHLARSILRELECELLIREEIARLVRFHGRPAFLLEKPDTAYEVISLSWLVNNQLLYLFALADTRGRTTNDTGRAEENLHLWKLVAEENNCFDKPFSFANDHARFLFYRSDKPNIYYSPHEEFSSTVILLSGLPGSGKDTWLAKHAEDIPTISLDDIRLELDIEPTGNQGAVIQAAKETCRERLRKKETFAFNATNLIRSTRKRWVDLFADYRAEIRMVYVEPKWKEILKQNQQRDQSVPESVIKKLAQKCEPPTWTEAHHLVVTED